MNSVRFGCIGAGGIADRRTLPAMKETKTCSLAALMDVARNEELGEKYGMPCYESEHELLAHDGIDAVYIASPVDAHLDQIKKAAATGKHILCEKPLTLTVAEAKEAVGAARVAGVLLQEGYMMRLHGAHQRIKEIIANGEIGKPVYARAQLACWYPPIEGAWRQVPERGGGGALIDMATHLYDLLEMFLGRITKVGALTGTQVHDYKVDDSSTTLLAFDSGTQATVDAFFCVPDAASRTRLEIYGSQGTILAEGTIGQAGGGKLEVYRDKAGKGYEAGQAKDEASSFEPEAFEETNPYAAELDSFARDVMEGRTKATLNDAEGGIHILKIVEAAYESSKSGKMLDVE